VVRGNVHQRRKKKKVFYWLWLNFRTHLEIQRCLLPFAADRFHVLFNPLFRVLFDFPSRYLSAIGLVGKYLALDGVYHPRLDYHLKNGKKPRSSLDCTLKQSDSIQDDASPHHVCAEKCRHGKSERRVKNPSSNFARRACHPRWVREKATVTRTWRRATCDRAQGNRDRPFNRHIASLSKDVIRARLLPLVPTFSRELGRFGVGLEACFHSQLLARSRLVSFPPPIDMLKFGGCSRLTRGLKLFRFVLFFRDCAKKKKKNLVSFILGPRSLAK
jgi:hypothetical protein